MKKFVSVLFVLFLMVAFSNTAFANVYATDVKVSNATIVLSAGDTTIISFRLNENADSGVNVKIYNSSSTLVRTISLTAAEKGNISVVWDVKDDLGNAVPEDNYSFEVTASDDGYTVWTKISVDTLTVMYSPKGIAINRDPNSPYFGRIYIANGYSGTSSNTGAFYNGDGVYMFNSTQDTIAFSDGGVDWSSSSNSPFKTAIGPDGSLYICDYGHDWLYQFDADISESSALLVLDDDNRVADQYIAANWVTGTGADRAIYTADAHYSTGQGIKKYDIGLDATMPDNDVGYVVIERPNGLFYQNDVELGSDGSIYFCQKRSAKGELVDKEDNIIETGKPINEAYPLLKYPAYTGTMMTIADTLWVVPMTYVGANGIGLDEPRGRVAYGDYYSGYVLVFDCNTGAFLDSVNTGRNRSQDVAFDAVGNLYNCDNSSEYWTIMSPPTGANSYTTPGLTEITVVENQPDLFFSEYIEGSSNNKAMEIYNGLDATINLDDYRIAQSVNGGGWQYYHYFPQGATLDAGDVWVILNSDASTVYYLPENADEVLSYPSVVHHNGDDARGLEKRSISGTDTTWTLIDIIGVPDVDPGAGWAVAGIADGTKDHTLVRKSNRVYGNADWTASAGTNAEDSEWIVYDKNTFVCLGSYPIPFLEEGANGDLDLTWNFNTAGGAGTMVVVDSTASTWGSEVILYTDESYTGIAYVEDAMGANLSVSADLYLIGPTDASAPLYTGLALKADSAALVYYRLVYRNSSSSNGQIKFQGYDGSWQTLKLWNPGVDFDTLETGWHNFDVRVVDNNFTVFLNGKMLPDCPIYVESPVIVNGFPGVFAYNTANGTVLFDNFVATEGVDPPLVDAGPDMNVEVNVLATLNGAIFNALPGNATTWTQISGPVVVLSDSSDLNATFTPTEEADYVFKLEITAGPYYGHYDEVIITAGEPDEDVYLTFEDDSDLANWSHHDEANQWTSEAWDATGGVGGTGALKFGDAGYGFLVKRPILATIGTAFTLTIDVKVDGWTDPVNYPLYLTVQGLDVAEPSIVINGCTDFTTVKVSGIATGDSGYIKIYGGNIFAQSWVWIDNLYWDDQTTTHTLSGTVTLSNGGDPSNALVYLAGYSDIWSDNPDASGNYLISLIPTGTYDVAATMVGYIDFVEPDFAIASDTTLDFTLLPGDLNLTFEDDSDKDNWGIYTLDNKWTGVKWDSVGGVDSSGALYFKDAGLGFAIERPVYATPGTYFSLSVDMRTKGFGTTESDELYLVISGVSLDDVAMTVTDFTCSDSFTTVTLNGLSVNENGYIQIYNYNTPSGKDTVWIDNLVWDDNATITTDTLSGTVTLSDGAVGSGAFVTLVNYEDYFSDSTDASGNYSISGIPTGTYDIFASKFGYKDSTLKDYFIAGDSTLDFYLFKNQPPIVVAPANVTGAQVGYSYILDASGCSDPDDDPITYHWFSDVDVEVYHSGNAGFRPDSLGTYAFNLFVNDGTENSDTVTATIEVTVAADPPVMPLEPAGKFMEGVGWSAQGCVVDPDGKLWGGWYSGSRNIRIYNADGVPAPFHPIQYGKIGETEYTLGACYGIAIGPDGNIYYADTGNDAVFKYDYKTGESLGGVLVGAGSPTVAVSGDGHIYVGKVLSSTFDVYDSAFNLVYSGTMEYGSVGREIEVTASGDTILCGGFSGNVYMLVGNITDGYTQVDNLPGPFGSGSDMSDIGIDANGNVYVNESTAKLLHIYSPDLSKRETYSLDVEDLVNIRGIGFAPSGDFVYAVDFDGSHIFRFAVPGATLVTPLVFVRENDENGEPVMIDSIITVQGVVTTNGAVFGSGGPGNLQAWNGSAGLSIYDSDFQVADEGDYVQVTGKVDCYGGLTELIDINVTVLDSHLVFDTLIVTGTDLQDDVAEQYEGVLVAVENVTLIDPGDWPVEPITSSGVNLLAYVGVDTFVIRIDRDTDISGNWAPTEPFTLIAIVSQYCYSAPYNSGYQLMPRSVDDFCGAIPVGVDPADLLPKVFALHQNYPNPFNPTTFIKYDLPKEAKVKIVIYNLMGREVRTLVTEKQNAGYKTVIWNGRNNNGQLVSSGCYIYHMVTDKFQKTKKMTLLK